jgi:NTE family protein
MTTNNGTRRGSDERKPVALALQGGGMHGAFTWGVLDRSMKSASTRR